MGHIWVLYGQKSLYGAHVGHEWDKFPDSAYMGPTYTCLLENALRRKYNEEGKRNYNRCSAIEQPTTQHCMCVVGEENYLALGLILTSKAVHYS